MESFSDSGFLLFLTTLFVITVSLFVAPYLRVWQTSTSRDNQRGYRINPRVIAISLVPLLMSFAVTPALAKDLFILATDTGSEYFIVDSEIVQPKISLTEIASPMTLDLLWSSPTFRRSNIFDMAITLDPGFRTSLTNQLITIAGRIDWSSTKPVFKEGKDTISKESVAYLSLTEHPESLLMADQNYNRLSFSNQ